MVVDVDRRLVTLQGARRYGVVLKADLSVDTKATETVRAEMARQRGKVPLFNFGGTIAELKARCKEETGFAPPETPTFAAWVQARQGRSGGRDNGNAIGIRRK